MASVTHKIHFQERALTLACGVGNSSLDNAYIHTETTGCQFVVDDVLHDVTLFLLAEIQTRIPQPHIAVEVFLLCTDIFPTLNVITRGFLQDECINKTVYICRNSIMRNVNVSFRLECILQFCGVGKASHRRRKNVQQVFQYIFRTSEIIAFYYICNICTLEKTMKIGGFFRMSSLIQHKWHATIHHKLRPRHTDVPLICRHELIKGKRINPDFLTTVFKFSEYIHREHLEIAASDIQIHIGEILQS